MKVLLVLFIFAVTMFGYGYRDSFGVGGRVQSLSPVSPVSPVSAGMCGATVPDGSSALSLFTNPSALAGSNKVLVSLTGWGTGWREEITYHYTCTEPYRFNLGAMSPWNRTQFKHACVCGYRPDAALKTGLGLSIGGYYTFGNYRVSAAYQYQGRYREGGAVPVSYINHIYDDGETVMIGFERSF